MNTECHCWMCKYVDLNDTIEHEYDYAPILLDFRTLNKVVATGSGRSVLRHTLKAHVETARSPLVRLAMSSVDKYEQGEVKPQYRCPHSSSGEDIKHCLWCGGDLVNAHCCGGRRSIRHSAGGNIHALKLTTSARWTNIVNATTDLIMHAASPIHHDEYTTPYS